MPAKKKGKKKVDNLARMSVDQRRQYLERKAAQEQERTRRREELLAGFLKLKLEDEQKKAGINEAKLNVKWREILRQVKSDSLVSQLQNLNLWINETVKSQDSIIELLMKSLKSASEQRTLTSQKHLTFVQNMSALHEEHISLLTQDFRNQEGEMIVKTAEEIQKATRNHLHQIRRFQLTEKAAVQSTELGEQEELTRFQDAVADVKAKLEEEATVAADLLEAQLEDAWYQLASTAKKFEEQTHDLREECSQLQEKVDTNMKTKQKVYQEVQELQAEISKWKSPLAEKYSEPLQVKESESVEYGLNLLRNSICSLRTEAREAIKRSNRVANSAFESLDETEHLGEEILHVADLCRRQETADDKNLPFLPTLPLPSIVSAILLEKLPNKIMQDDAYATLEYLNSIAWKKQNSYRENDSGVGSSNRTQNEKSSDCHTLPKDTVCSETDTSALGTLNEEQDQTTAIFNLSLHDNRNQPIAETTETTSPKAALPKVTLERIHDLVQDENVLRDIVESYGHRKTHTSDFVMKGTELLMRTHESLSHFWCKLNNVEVQRLSLMKEAEDLRQENIALKESLKNFIYSQGITDICLGTSKSPVAVKAFSILERMADFNSEGSEDDSQEKLTKVMSRRLVQDVVKPVIEGKHVVRASHLHRK